MINKKLDIPVPGTINWQSALEFRISLPNIPDYSHYRFDFSDVGHVEPFGMILVADAIREFMANHRDSKFDANGCKDGYVAHMGFYKACGFEFGNDTGEAKGSNKYLPITYLLGATKFLPV